MKSYNLWYTSLEYWIALTLLLAGCMSMPSHYIMEYVSNLNGPCPPYMSKQKGEYISRLCTIQLFTYLIAVLEESIFAACVITSNIAMHLYSYENLNG